MRKTKAEVRFEKRSGEYLLCNRAELIERILFLEDELRQAEITARDELNSAIRSGWGDKDR